MHIRIVVSYVPRYRRGHGIQFVPPVTGIHLAAITPKEHRVEVVHEQVRSVPFTPPPDLVAISFFSGFARQAYQTADRFRAMGVPVVAGGPHASYWVEETLKHADAVVVGEAEEVWPQVIADFERGKPQKVYRGKESSMQHIPMARYDLLEDAFVVPRVLQATRGCPFTCRFCSVPDLNPGFRMRPTEDVVRDIEESHFPRFWQDKVVWFWDDNLLVNRPWAKRLLSEMRGLNRWWLTQASIDIVHDKDLLDRMEASGCIGIFLGIESLDAVDLKSVDKRQNHAERYRDAIERLHGRGICVMAGFISGFDGHTPQAIEAIADRLNAVGVDVPFLSILTPFRGTPLYDDFLRDGRLLEERDWPHYNGYNVAFQPARMRPDELLGAHRALWKRAFDVPHVAERLSRGLRRLSPGGMMLSAAMNGFYGVKRMFDNIPADAPTTNPDQIEHPKAEEPPVRLSSLVPKRKAPILSPTS